MLPQNNGIRLQLRQRRIGDIGSISYIKDASRSAFPEHNGVVICRLFTYQFCGRGINRETPGLGFERYSLR